jgi:16S rRNA (uracil1498-N3)-methyltransferase
VTVSRVRTGERIAIGDGRGIRVHGVVTSTGPRELTLEADEVVVQEPPATRITLVQALAKGDRDELAVQAATELGVDAIVPWAASRSVSRWEGPKAEKGRQRWAAIVREAVKQSIRSWLPPVASVTSTDALPAALGGCRMLLLEPTATTALTELRPDGRDLALVVGPEGGIAPAELEALVAAGAEPVRLGASVLRTSTAGPAAIAVLNATLGRW